MPTPDLSPKAMRKHFAELSARFEPKAEKRDALKRERDELAEKGTLTLKQSQDFDEKIRKANEGLYDLEMQRAVVARALGGKTSEPAEG